MVLRSRYVVALLAVFVSLATVASFVVNKPRSEAAVLVDRFVAALDQRDVAAAAALTSYPNAAAHTIGAMFDSMGPGVSTSRMSQYIGLDDESGFFTVDSTWSFGEPRGQDSREWRVTTQGSTRKLGVGWRISWDPSILAPELRAGGSVRYARTDAPAPRVLDASGAVMMAEQNVASVRLDPSATSDLADTTSRLADVIDVVAPLITSESLQADVAADPGAVITAVNLRADDYAVLEDDLRAIPGVVLYAEPKLIAGDRRLTSPVLDSLRTVWQDSRDATAGWAVEVADTDGETTRLAGFQGPGSPDITSTLDPAVQLAAETAAVSVGTPASIVVMKPSTGAVVATAQNSYANDEGTPAFTGLYPAGTLVDVIQASADRQKIGFSDAARQFGLGTSFDIPGLDAVTASLPDGQSAVDQFRGVSRTSSVSGMTVTPFGLAEMAAAVARGSAPAPMIVGGAPATVSGAGSPVAPAVLTSLRNTLRDNARSEGVSDPSVTGLAGDNGDDRWFLGTKGDLAFAVYIEDADGTDAAARMTNMLMREMASPSE
ncbi:penicillin-binding protein [Rhodococcus sp. BP-332]|uniref:penicillin-binding protein n=1 Tax=Rhodococcus sp. BP-332 TaxID=2739447 RepID=UPI001C9B3D75|nr:penicillin-binding protein [Rhodococcus sp. BP-332]MBY6677152.1 penicillin-binding protein [Rhodococcus sp. BP-332]